MTTPTQPDYPPLTSTEDYPLHGWDYGAPYACQGGVSTYDWRCLDCVNVARTKVAFGRDVMTRWRQSGEHEERDVTLGWLVAQSRYHGIGKEATHDE